MGFWKNLFAKEDTKTVSGVLEKDIIAEHEGEDLDDLFESNDEEFLYDLNADEIDVIVKKMLQDDQVSSELETFKTYIGNSEYFIFSPDENNRELADLYEHYLTRDGNRLIKEINNFYEALEYGHVSLQVIWKKLEDTGGEWIIERLKPLNHTRYGFNKRYELIDKQNGKVLDEPYKFITVSHNVRGGNPNGNSLILKAYWPWFFRKTCIKAGLLYVKKSVIPSIIALYQAAQNKDIIDTDGASIAAKLSKLGNSSGIALANVDDIKKIEASSKGTDIIDMIELFNRMISKALFGVSTLTNESRFSANDTADTLEELIEKRAQKVATQEIQPEINTLLKWTLELNRGEIPPENSPYFRYVYKYDPSYEEVMKALDRSVGVSGSWFYEKFNIQKPEDEEDELITKSEPVIPPDDVNAEKQNNDGFFLRSERQTNKPSLMNETSRYLRDLMASE